MGNKKPAGLPTLTTHNALLSVPYSQRTTTSMNKVMYHLRRNRNYSSHERWGVFAGLFILTLAVTAGGWLLLGKPASSAASVTVTDIKLSQNTLPIGIDSEGTVTLTLANKETTEPAEGVWVGLRVPLSELRTPQFSYYDWYSPESERAFYQTDTVGKVVFPLASLVTGTIEYEIYTANPELANDAKYQSLNQKFTVSYE